MPVVINELVFRAEISSSIPDRTNATGADRRPPVSEKEIIEACVEEVMRILERKKER
jgi:hypothetical protein